MKTKGLIYEGALKSFAHQGYNGTTMDRIAEVCGVAKGPLYYNFKTKEELFVFVMKTGLTSLMVKLKNDVQEAREGLQQKVKALIFSHLDFFQQERDFCRLLLDELWDSQRRYPVIRQTLQEYFSWLEEQLHAIRRERDLPKQVDIHTLSSSFFGMIVGTAMRAIARGQSLHDPELLSSLQQISIHALGIQNRK